MKRFTLYFAAGCAFSTAALRAQSPSPDERVEALVRQLPLEQKIDLIGGESYMDIRPLPQIGFPRLRMSDGPFGVRSWGTSTAYAAGAGLAASWDRALAAHLGASFGRDARARGVHFLLGPGVNLYRSPLNGRNFEYLGEDPFLAGAMAVSFISGVQQEGVVATVKHFAANNSEFDRHNTNAIIDERTLREIYLPAFEAAVKDGHVGAVMDSYNLVNGQHATQNRVLNTEILRQDWGFRGILMTDWVATYDGVAAANSGLDLEMPSAKFMNRQTLLPAIKAGKVAEATLDEKVRHILSVAVQFHFFDRPQRDESIPLFDQRSRAMALQSAQEAIVLLKNEGGILPLDLRRLRRIQVLGPNGNPAVVGGGGSSNVTPFESTSLLIGLRDALKETRVVIDFAAGLKERKDGTGANDEAVDPEALSRAARADVAIISVGFGPHTEREGWDRTFELPPGQDALIRAVEAVNPHTIVVLTAGGAVDTRGWLDHTPALLDGFYGGQEGGQALAQVLVGQLNPAGHLPFSWERAPEDNPTYLNYHPKPGETQVVYREGIFLGYRHYDRSPIKPQFPFGFGLSYTSFAFSELQLSPSSGLSSSPLQVTFSVRNTGQRAGAEVAQIYVGDPSATVPRPLHELKGFARVMLAPGESKRLSVQLDRRAFAYWDVTSHGWKVDPGQFTISVGDSSTHLPLQASLLLRN